MSEALAITFSVAPYVLLALGLGAMVTVSAGWVFSNSQRWLFYAVLAFALPALGAGDGTDGSLWKQMTWGTVFLITSIQIFGVSRGRFAMPEAEFPPRLLLAVVAFAIISVLWSPVPLISGKRAVQLIGVMVIAMIAARQSLAGVGLRRQLLRPTGTFLLIGLIASAVVPGFAFDAGGALNAIASHKNTWGQFSLLVALVFLFTLSNAPKVLWLPIAGLMAASVSLILSKSTTSLLALAFIGSLAALRYVWSKGLLGRLVIVLALIFACGAVLVFTIAVGDLPFGWLYDGIFRLTDKSQTLTGRTFLWQLMGNEIAKHPWFGIGYGGFWLGFDGPSAAVISKLNWGPPTQAHSGYIDVVNEVGIVGACLLGIALLVHAFKIAKLWSSAGQQDADFHAAILIAILFINYAESSLLRTTHLWWIIFCCSMIEVHVRFMHNRIQIATGRMSDVPTPFEQLRVAQRKWSGA